MSKIILKKQSFLNNFFSYLLAMLPLSFILGNTIINLNILLLIFSSIIFFRSSILKLNLNILDKLVFAFFCLIILNGIINDIYYLNYHKDFSHWKGVYKTFLKSLGYFRFFIFYIVLRYLIENKILNLKIFFISCTFFLTFVCLDILYQLYFGRDIFGFEPIARKFPGPFGDEPISGGYILRFSLFCLFIHPLFLEKNSKSLFFLFLTIFLLICPIAILISGNRMSFVLFVLLSFSILVFQKDLRKYFFPYIFISSFVFLLAFNFNDRIKSNFQNFNYQINEIYSFIIKNDFEQKKLKNNDTYLDQFKSFGNTWKQNKYFGGGIKNFRYNCHLANKLNINHNYVCNMHPHNYYLEILTETGIVGFLLVILIFFGLILKSLKPPQLKNLSRNYSIITPFLFLFLIEIFPIKGTGSFFTTSNASYLFLILGILSGLTQSKRNKL